MHANCLCPEFAKILCCEIFLFYSISKDAFVHMENFLQFWCWFILYSFTLTAWWMLCHLYYIGHRCFAVFLGDHQHCWRNLYMKFNTGCRHYMTYYSIYIGFIYKTLACFKYFNFWPRVTKLGNNILWTQIKNPMILDFENSAYEKFSPLSPIIKKFQK